MPARMIIPLSVRAPETEVINDEYAPVREVINDE